MKMNINEKVEYWLELSDYDFETAEAMLNSQRFLYVGFMCHQSVEKMLKAVFVKKFEEIPPFTHSLSQLLKNLDFENIMSEKQLGIIDKLEPLNIETRYPTYKEELFRLLTKEYCNTIFSETQELLKWIKAQL